MLTKNLNGVCRERASFERFFMDRITTEGLACIFGDKTISIDKDRLEQAPSLAAVADQEPFASLRAELGATHLIFPCQVHGVASIDLFTPDHVQAASSGPLREADFSITTLPGVALGVETADCLPLVLHDPKTPALAVVHAGWKGSVAEIARIAVERMQRLCKTNPANVLAYLGPSATGANYAVGDVVLQALKTSRWSAQVIEQRNEQFYFDIPKLNALQLQAAGVLPKHIFTHYNRDTIVNTGYWSYRRDREKALRNLTVAMLM